MGGSIEGEGIVSKHLKLSCPSWPRVNDGDVNCSRQLGWLTVMSTTAKNTTQSL